MTQLRLTWQDDVTVMSVGVCRRVKGRVGPCKRVRRRATRGRTHRKRCRRVRVRGMLDGDRSGVAK